MYYKVIMLCSKWPHTSFNIQFETCGFQYELVRANIIYIILSFQPSILIKELSLVSHTIQNTLLFLFKTMIITQQTNWTKMSTINKVVDIVSKFSFISRLPLYIVRYLYWESIKIWAYFSLITFTHTPHTHTHTHSLSLKFLVGWETSLLPTIDILLIIFEVLGGIRN